MKSSIADWLLVLNRGFGLWRKMIGSDRQVWKGRRAMCWGKMA